MENINQSLLPSQEPDFSARETTISLTEAVAPCITISQDSKQFIGTYPIPKTDDKIAKE